jgi:hypothetical protein
MKKVDFRQLQAEAIDGSIITIDVSKDLANMIYNSTKECGEAIFAQELYKNGEVELTEENIAIVKKYYNDFLYFAKAAIDKAMAQ